MSAGDGSYDVATQKVKTLRFGPDFFNKNGSRTASGGAHFFYGNPIQLDAGHYNATVVIQNPQHVRSPRITIEAATWSNGEYLSISHQDFILSHTPDFVIVTLDFEVPNAGEVEFRGWSDAKADQIEMRQLSIKPAQSALIEDEWVKSAILRPHSAKARFSLNGLQLFCFDGVSDVPLMMTVCDAAGSPLYLCQLIGYDRQPALPSGSASVMIFLLPEWLLAPGLALIFAMDLDVYFLSMATTDAATPAETLAGETGAASRPHVHETAPPDIDVLAAVARLATTTQESAQRLEKLEEHVNGKIASAMSELDSWRRQMPTLLNAISSAHAASSIVSRFMLERNAAAANGAEATRSE